MTKRDSQISVLDIKLLRLLRLVLWWWSLKDKREGQIQWSSRRVDSTTRENNIIHFYSGRNISFINVVCALFFTSFFAILTDRIFSMMLASSSGGSWGTQRQNRLAARKDEGQLSEFVFIQQNCRKTWMNTKHSERDITNILNVGYTIFPIIFKWQILFREKFMHHGYVIDSIQSDSSHKNG